MVENKERPCVHCYHWTVGAYICCWCGDVVFRLVGWDMYKTSNWQHTHGSHVPKIKEWGKK